MPERHSRPCFLTVVSIPITMHGGSLQPIRISFLTAMMAAWAFQEIVDARGTSMRTYPWDSFITSMSTMPFLTMSWAACRITAVGLVLLTHGPMVAFAITTGII